MNRKNDRVLIDALIQQGFFSKEKMEEFIPMAESSEEDLKTFLVGRGEISEEQVLKVLALHLNTRVIDLKNIEIPDRIIEKIPVRFAWYYKFMPVDIDEKTLTLAVFSPMEVKTQDEIRVHLGLQPNIVFAKENDVVDAIKKYYGLAADTIDKILTKDPGRKDLSSDGRSTEMADIESMSEDASVTKLVNQIMLEAYKKRATDIHIEPYRNKVRFRYRIDGVLVDANLPDDIKHFLLPILSRIKIMSNLSIVEKRLPQDGSAVVKTKDQVLDLRISTMPTPNGESMVIRILPSKVILFSLEKLGLKKENVSIFRELIKKPHGIIFVTGPTGSGKTTTLYACLNEINSPRRKIITIEDPVEYELEGVTQIQVNRKVNLDFAVGLRSILRHDPDIIMVGEVRDLETAEIAIRTALTGHLVFSTLHTNDASSGVTRLIDMGVEPYLVASSIEAFVAQRLVRVICPRCKEEDAASLDEVKKEMVEALKIKDIRDIKIYKGRGCDHCNRTGFYGRTAIHEILVMTESIRAALLERPRAEHIKKIAQQYGMVTLRQDGWDKVFRGITTPAEVMNVTSREDYGYGAKDRVISETLSEKNPSSASRAGTSSVKVISPEILDAKNDYDSRIYERLDTRIEVTYKVLHGEPSNPEALRAERVDHTTVTKNISAGGVVLISSDVIPVGSILDLKIHLQQDERSLNCLAKVCRVEQNNLSKVYQVVAYFLDATSADRAKINNFVKEKVKREKT